MSGTPEWLRFASLAAIVAMVLFGGREIASAEPSKADKEEASAAFKRAEAADARQDWRTAIEEYQRAYELVPHPDALFNIAQDFELLGQYRTAATYFLRYLDDLDENSDESTRARVKKLVGALRARPAALTVTSEPIGAAVTIDGRAAGATPLTIELPGAQPHEVAVALGAAAAETLSVTLEYGEPQTLHVVVPVASTSVERDQVAAAGELTGSVEASPSDQRDSRRTRRLVALSVTGAGLVATGASLWLGATADDRYDRAVELCGAELNCTEQSDYDLAVEHVSAARTRGNVASVAAGAGVAAIITGVALWFTAPATSEPSARDTHVFLVPSVGPGAIGFTAARRF